MNISKCLNCYRELLTEQGDSFCSNERCYRYGLCTRRVFHSTDDLSGGLPKIEINFLEFIKKGVK